MPEMTDEQINRAIAEKVFGFTGDRAPKGWKWWATDEQGAPYARIPNFMNDELRAFCVVEEMRGRGYAFRLWGQPFAGPWRAKFWIPVTLSLGMAIADKSPQAICLSALKALEAKG